MKRLALVAAVLVVAACGKKEEAPADTSLPTTTAPAAGAMDSLGNKLDTMAGKVDSMAKATVDTMKKMVDSAKKH